MAETEAWKAHVFRVGQEHFNKDTPPDEKQAAAEHRRKIEPWLSAVFQSEHLSLLVGNGLLTSVSTAAGVKSVPSMGLPARARQAAVVAAYGRSGERREYVVEELPRKGS